MVIFWSCLFCGALSYCEYRLADYCMESCFETKPVMYGDVGRKSGCRDGIVLVGVQDSANIEGWTRYCWDDGATWPVTICRLD
jgi:hypothetical protein